MTTLIDNVRLVTADTVIDRCGILLDTHICAIGRDLPAQEADLAIDGQGRYLWPGLIDQHIHGCAGLDAMDGGKEIEVIAAHLPAAGVTAFVPSTVSAPMADICELLADFRAYKNSRQGARILGLHLEGPFLNPGQTGAHDPGVLGLPQIEPLRPYLDLLHSVTLAPELPGAKDFAMACQKQGVSLWIGHSQATYAQCVEAVSWGFSNFVHTYNGMDPLQPREPGCVGAAMTLPDTYAELIADNIHVAPAAQKALWQCAGPDRLILVTDAMRACMMPDGTYTFGAFPVTVTDGRVTLANGRLAGSTLTLPRAIWNLKENTGCTLPQAVACASLNPARHLGIDRQKGSLAVGKDADVVLLDDDGCVHFTMVEGRPVYVQSGVMDF